MKEMISIIVPVHNAERFIRETIESVLAQTEPDFELILVDDCSTDKSTAIINEFDDSRICLIRQPENLGAYAARNRGLEEAHGRYIAFLDADDLWTPDKLKKTLLYLREEGTGFVFTGYEFVDENGKSTGAVVKVPKRRTFKSALNNTDIFTSTVMLDRSIIPDELIRMPHMKSEDTATWWTILKAGHEAAGLNEPLVRYRRSGGSLSANKVEAIRRIWNLYRKVAGLNVVSSAFHFCLWAVTAVWRRL